MPERRQWHGRNATPQPADNPGNGAFPMMAPVARGDRLRPHQRSGGLAGVIREVCVGSNVTLTASDGFKLGAYRAEPQGKPKGGLVVIQEIFGVNHHIKAVTDRQDFQLAAEMSAAKSLVASRKSTSIAPSRTREAGQSTTKLPRVVA